MLRAARCQDAASFMIEKANRAGTVPRHRSAHAKQHANRKCKTRRTRSRPLGWGHMKVSVGYFKPHCIPPYPCHASASPHGLMTSLPAGDLDYLKSEKQGCSSGPTGERDGCPHKSNNQIMPSNVIYTQQKYTRCLCLLHSLPQAMTAAFLNRCIVFKMNYTF